MFLGKALITKELIWLRIALGVFKAVFFGLIKQ